MKSIKNKSVLSCPKCGYQETLSMPADACQWFHECAQCQALLNPKPGDCCVFCSYGSEPCPPVQLQRDTHTTGGCCSGIH